MIKRISCIAITCILLSIGASAAQSQTAFFEQHDAATAEKIDELFADFDRDDAPGFAVGVVQNGALVYSKGFGISNLDYGIPITPQSVFNIASLSKQFTAACIALLIQQGKVSLDADVKTYIPDFPDYPGPIKIKHLLYMTSGLKEYYQLDRPGGRSWYTDYFTVDDAITRTLKEPELDFEPGSAWAYSNVNYMLLTKVVEAVSNMSFSAFAQSYLFYPLEMQDTHVNDDIFRVVENRAIGYNPRQEGGYRHFNRRSPHYGGSGIHATVEDLYKWDQSFYNHTLGEEVSRLMVKTMKFDHDKANDAFGLVWNTYRELPMLWYEGGDTGFSAYMVRFPDQQFSVICLANFVPADGRGMARRKAHEILDLYHRTGE